MVRVFVNGQPVEKSDLEKIDLNSKAVKRIISGKITPYKTERKAVNQ